MVKRASSNKQRLIEKIKIGPPMLTSFEKARILGARALQLSMGAPPLIDLSDLPSKDPVKIAEEELRRGLLPITIRRITPSGRYQIIPIKWLLEAEKEVYE